MTAFTKSARSAVTILCGAVWASCFVWAQASAAAPPSGTKDRARVMLARTLPKLDGAHLRATLVEVSYGPGEASPPHSHPCPVIGHVVEGTIRTQVKGEPEMIYKAGESFYEPAGGVHMVSANGSAWEPAKFIALFVCDHEAPLSTNVPQGAESKGK